MRVYVSFSFVLLALVSCFILYLPGLQGSFLLDDIPNLQTLGYFGGVNDASSALYYIFTNGSGPLGRPLSMLSFLLNDHAWPSTAYPFKYTNVLIHLINGLLLYWFVGLLVQRLDNRCHQQWVAVASKEKCFSWVAVAVTWLWLIHPMQVSSVLYVVQRMTLLASTFILLGLIVYLKLRGERSTLSKEVKLLLSLGVIGSLGLLFKETAVSLIIYLALIEFFVIQPQYSLQFSHLLRDKSKWLSGGDTEWLLLRVVLVGLCVALMGFLIYEGVTADVAWAQRGYGWYSRLLTEFRILWEYLFGILVPRSAGAGLFHDDIVVSAGLMSPITTLISILSWVAAFFLVFKITIFRFCALPLLWFVGGHILESTVLPLELYFEHRNYLSIVGPLLFLVLLVKRLPVKIQKLGRYSLVVFVFVNVFVAHNNVWVWSDEELMREVWALEHPTSVRAQQVVIGDLVNKGEYEKASTFMQRIIQSRPNDHQVAMQAIILKCLQGDKIQKQKYLDIFNQGGKSVGVYDGVLVIKSLAITGQCASIDLGFVESVIKIFIQHPGYQDVNMRSFMFRELAVINAMRGDLNSSISMLDKARSVDPNNVIFPLDQAVWLADAGLYKEADEFLLQANEAVSKNIFKAPMQKKLIEKTRETIASMRDK